MEFRRFDESMAMSFPQLLRVPINFLTRPKVHVTVAPFCESVLLDKRREQGRENQLKILNLTNSFVLFFFLLLSTSLSNLYLVCKRITKIFDKQREMICTPPHDAQIPHMNRAKEEGNNPYTIWKTLLFSCNLLTLHRRFIKLPTACI